MRIDFFEEYPHEPAALAAAAAVDFPSTVYLAAPDRAAFERAAAALAAANPDLEPGWWPVLPASYWVSPWSDRSELERLGAELAAAEPGPLLLDLELPLLRPGRLLAGLPGLLRGRAAVRDLARRAVLRGHRVASAEYPFQGALQRRLLDGLGLSLPPETGHEPIPMAYSSLLPGGPLRRAVQRRVGALIRRWPGPVRVGVGTIGRGAFGHEPRLPPAALARDVDVFRRAGAAGVVVFRLGGADGEWLEVLRRAAAGQAPAD